MKLSEAFRENIPWGSHRENDENYIDYAWMWAILKDIQQLEHQLEVLEKRQHVSMCWWCTYGGGHSNEVK